MKTVFKMWALYSVTCGLLLYGHGGGGEAVHKAVVPSSPKPQPAIKHKKPQNGRARGEELEEALIVGVRNLYNDYNYRKLLEMSPNQRRKLFENTAAEIKEDKEEGTRNLTKGLELTFHNELDLQNQIQHYDVYYHSLNRYGISSPFLLKRLDTIMDLYQGVLASIPKVSGLTQGDVSKSKLIPINTESILAKCGKEEAKFTRTQKGIKEAFFEAVKSGKQKRLREISACKLLVGRTPRGREIYVKRELVLHTLVAELRATVWDGGTKRSPAESVVFSGQTPKRELIFRKSSKGWFWAGYVRP